MKQPPQVLHVKVEGDFALTERQLGVLVHVVQSLDAIRNPVSDEEWKAGNGPELDRGFRIALDSALASATTRITHMVEDSSRWARGQKLPKEVREAISSQTELNEENSANEALRRRPVHQFKASFARLKAGGWIAYLTDASGNPSVIGEGLTPEEAARDFDNVFLNSKPLEDPQKSTNTEDRSTS